MTLSAKILTALVVIGLIVGISLGFASCTTIDAGHVGVVSTFGKVDDTVLPEGIHGLNPFSWVTKVSVRQTLASEKCDAASSDLQSVSTTVGVQYHPLPDSAAKLYREVGKDSKSWEDIVVDPAIHEIVKAVTAKFTAENLVKQRDAVKAEVTQRLIERLSKYNLVVIEVNITDFGFSKAFDDAIEAKQRAEQQALQAKNELDKVKIDAEQTVTKADAERRAQQARADAAAYTVTADAKARAEAYKLIDASLTDKVLRNRWLEKWDGVMPRVLGSDAGLMLPPEMVK